MINYEQLESARDTNADDETVTDEPSSDLGTVIPHTFDFEYIDCSFGRPTASKIQNTGT